MAICQEIIHTLRYTKDKRGDMVLELDFVAYDRMAWAFVEESLRDASLPLGMINVIMDLIGMSHCKLIWKGKVTDSIRSSRGLRQRDLSSPYIFVRYLKRLSHWIQSRVDTGQ